MWMEAHPVYTNIMHQNLLEIETKAFYGFSDQGTLVSHGFGRLLCRTVHMDIMLRPTRVNKAIGVRICRIVIFCNESRRY